MIDILAGCGVFMVVLLLCFIGVVVTIAIQPEEFLDEEALKNYHSHLGHGSDHWWV